MNPVEEKFYETAGQEIASKSVKRGLWTKAFAVAQGDEQRTKAAYIELRVEELREEHIAETARQNETDSQRRHREDAIIKERFSSLTRLPYQDADDIPRSRFDGQPNQLRYPISAVRVAEVIGLLHFEVVDLIKRGHIKGIYSGGDWYCDLEANA